MVAWSGKRATRRHQTAGRVQPGTRREAAQHGTLWRKKASPCAYSRRLCGSRSPGCRRAPPRRGADYRGAFQGRDGSGAQTLAASGPVIIGQLAANSRLSTDSEWMWANVVGPASTKLVAWAGPSTPRARCSHSVIQRLVYSTVGALRRSECELVARATLTASFAQRCRPYTPSPPPHDAWSTSEQCSDPSHGSLGACGGHTSPAWPARA
jgi:hypothetical protein